ATFGGDRDLRLQPTGGRQGLLAALVAARGDSAAVDRTALKGASTPGAVTPAGALSFLGPAAPRGGLVVVVSDFRGPRDWATAMAGVTSRATVLVVEIRDPREDELTDVGTLTLVDGETGREVRVETSSRALREKFATAAAAERADLARELRRLGARHVVLSTSGSWLRSLAGPLRTIRRASCPSPRRSSSWGSSSSPPRSGCTSSCSAAAAATRSGSRTWTCSRTLPPRPPPGGPTSPPACTSS